MRPCPPRRRRGALAWASLALAMALLTGGCSISVADSTLSPMATSYWLFAESKDARTVFTPEDEFVTLHVRLDFNVVASTQTFRTEWIEPSGEPYVGGGVRTVFGSNRDVIVSLELAGSSAAQKFGVWRVRLYHGERTLVDRSFEIRQSL